MTGEMGGQCFVSCRRRGQGQRGCKLWHGDGGQRSKFEDDINSYRSNVDNPLMVIRSAKTYIQVKRMSVHIGD